MSENNLEKYKKDLDELVTLGISLKLAMHYECNPDQIKARLKKKLGDKSAEVLKELPDFNSEYQSWYSESLAIVKLMLPDRLEDFIRLFRKPKNRREISYENYVMEDFLQGLVTRNSHTEEYVVKTSAGLSKFEQQLNILKSVKRRFESSLFDIKQIVQADIFDSELEAAEELNDKGYIRAAGALAGVVLESHLSQVCENHSVVVAKKDPGISDLNDILKKEGVMDTSNWRFIQRLGDLRNKCDHKKTTEPTKEEVGELIEGVGKVLKTIF